MELISSDIERSNKGQKSIDVLRGALRPVIHYLDSPDIQEIMINQPGEIWVESHGIMQRATEKLSPIAVEIAIRALASHNEKKKTPIMDARLPGIRVAAVMSPIALNGHAMSIRKHTSQKISLADYVESGAFSPMGEREVDLPGAAHSLRPSVAEVKQGGAALQAFFTWAITHRQNILISGGTSSGKTTLTNALLEVMPKHHRVITIEDTAELKLSVPNRVSFEANKELEVDIRALVRVCLRFRPDRIVVGEIRGAEAYDLVDSLNTGHSGGITTIHADSAESALDRLENLMRMSPETANYPNESMRRQIAQTFRFIVQAANIGGKRGPVRVVEVTGYEHGLYLFNELFSRIPKEE
ncbi:MAG: P-type DNA transfer ATPase VirB11 [Sulfuriferula sp.]